jgi:phosphotriesterase-related protein
MNIIFCTGYHPMIGADFYFDVARGTGIDIDDLAEMFIHDIRVGAQGTDRKASIIKVGTAPSGDEWQERGLRAAARAHRATGVPITTHSEPADRDGLYQLDVFESEGVDLSRVIIGHSGDSSDREYLSELVARGCYIGMDRFGFMIETFLKPLSTEERIEIVKDMISRDAVGAMVMSHDSCSWCDYVPPDYIQEINPEWNICYLMDTAMPQMRAAGVSDAAIETMATQNPRDIFSNVEPY